MSAPAVEVESLWKEYAIGGQENRPDNFREMLSSALSAPFRRFLRDGAEAPSEQFWALKDINLQIKAGEVVGIIGGNGAGKSTLLKVLSRITDPTKGEARIRGRVASLLEVGTGFHPELSGRENVYLNGAILGMTRAEIGRKFDEIVAFAEIDKFLDTPVKRYSSGMYVRLAFSVAAHLDPEILIIDEVLAVGDAAFQKKCLGKMGDVGRAGRTILFVSHNMTAVSQLCSRAVSLERGAIKQSGAVSDVVSDYLGSGLREGSVEWPDRTAAPGGRRIKLTAVRVLSGGRVASAIPIDQPADIEVEFLNLVPSIRGLFVYLSLHDATGMTVLCSANTEAASLNKSGWFHEAHGAGLYRARCRIPPNFLNSIRYSVSVQVLTLDPDREEAAAAQVVAFSVHDTGVMREPSQLGPWQGQVRIPLEWHTESCGDG
jgi:lipopolysaccharide transport system ATP-binding protein